MAIICCSGRCKWEENDYINGGTRCLRPLREKCLMEEEESEEIYKINVEGLFDLNA